MPEPVPPAPPPFGPSGPYGPTSRRRSGPRPALLVTLALSSGVIVTLVGLLAFALAVGSDRGVTPTSTGNPIPSSSTPSR